MNILLHKVLLNLKRTFQTLKKEQNAPVEEVHKTVEKLLIELVLTAHPTETTRRSLIHKHIEINKCLSKLEHHDLTEKNVMIIGTSFFFRYFV